MTATVPVSEADLLGAHRLQGSDDAKRCLSCGIHVWRRITPRHEPGPRVWFQWYAPDGRDWSSFPEGDGWVSYPDAGPSCPPQEVEARCPWEEDARRYGHVWGDVQLEVAQRTWCERHQMTVADCPEPGEICRGADGNCAWEGRCTGRENSCECACPVCAGDTPDVWGAPVY